MASGWNRPSANHPVKKGGAKPDLKRGIIAGLAAVVLGAVCVWMFSGDDATKPPREKATKTIKAAKPARTELPRPGAGQSSVATSENAIRESRDVERKQPIPKTRDRIDPPEPLADVVEKAKKTKPRFATATERFIAMATPADPGNGVPPIPISDEEDYSEDMKKAFATPVVAEDGDDEAAIRAKIKVLDAKEELKRLAEEEHWTLQRYVNALREKHILDNEYLAACHEMVERAYADVEVSDDAYVAMRDKVNETLKERGLPEILSVAEEDAQAAAEETEASDRKPLNGKQEDR